MLKAEGDDCGEDGAGEGVGDQGHERDKSK